MKLLINVIHWNAMSLYIIIIEYVILNEVKNLHKSNSLFIKDISY